MNKGSRTLNFTRNIGVSMGMQVLLLLLTFTSRTIFIKILGSQYLGISGLYSNILSVLSLADLGINTVMIYALYKPIANNDTDTLARLVNYFKKLYRYVAAAVLTIGLLCVPFLQMIIKDSTLAMNELRYFFILYLVNTVCSYLIVYKTTLINADQNVYIIKIIDFIASLLLNILQIIVLFATHNFYLYLVVNIAITLLKNCLMSYITNRRYPFLKETKIGLVDPEIRSKLKENIKSIFLYRVSAMVMNSTDNILISVILGTVVVGQYSNYLMITTTINTFISTITQSVLASLGNFNATENSERKLLMFRSLLLVYYAIATFCSCCFIGMFNDFIRVWIGRIDPSYVLSDFSMYAITFAFFVSCVLNPIWMFRESNGLFRQVKYSMAFAALINIVLSIILGKALGLGGIVAATAISKLMTNFWFEPKVLYRQVFHDSTKKYWFCVLRLFLTAALCVIIAVPICKMLPDTIPFILLRILISGLITGIVFYLFTSKTTEFAYLKGISIRSLRRSSSI